MKGGDSMKKVILFSLIFCLIFIIGCSSNTKPEVSNNPSLQQTQTFKVGDSIQLGDYVLIVHGTADNVPYEDTEYDRPEEGNKYFAVEVTVENKGSEANSYNPLDFTLQDSSGYTFEKTYTVSKEPSLSSGDLQPGRKVRGWITFEIPKTSSNLELIYKPDIFDSGQVIVKLY
jgi:hypothetical protein